MIKLSIDEAKQLKLLLNRCSRRVAMGYHYALTSELDDWVKELDRLLENAVIFQDVIDELNTTKKLTNIFCQCL